MKTVFIIPGFRHKVSDKGYVDLVKIFNNKQIKVEVVPINWKYSSFSNWSDEFNKFYEKHKTNETILLGFSYGAMIALAAAIKIQPNLLILCSLSPYFMEDLLTMRKLWLKNIGKRQLTDFEKLSFNDLAERVNCRTILFLGEKETKRYPELANRLKAAHQIIKSNLVIIPHADHNIGQSEYLEAIEKIEI